MLLYNIEINFHLIAWKGTLIVCEWIWNRKRMRTFHKVAISSNFLISNKNWFRILFVISFFLSLSLSKLSLMRSGRHGIGRSWGAEKRKNFFLLSFPCLASRNTKRIVCWVEKWKLRIDNFYIEKKKLFFVLIKLKWF